MVNCSMCSAELAENEANIGEAGYLCDVCTVDEEERLNQPTFSPAGRSVLIAWFVFWAFSASYQTKSCDIFNLEIVCKQNTDWLMLTTVSLDLAIFLWAAYMIYKTDPHTAKAKYVLSRPILSIALVIWLPVIALRLLGALPQ